MNWTSRLSGLLLLLSVLLIAMPAQAQERSDALPRVSPNAMVNQTFGVTDVTIRYGRPYVRGREIYGGLVPYGEVWRTGANEATAITFSDDVMIEGQPLEAGTYALFTIPGEEEWTIIFNNAQQWGAFNYDEADDALRVTVTPEEAPMQEMMTFHIPNVTDSSAQIVHRWAETAVPFTVTVDTKAAVRARANTAASEAEDWRGPYQYAAYALEHGVYLDEALGWADRSIEMEENFNNLALKARLLAETGDYAAAAEVGAQAVEKGEAMDEAPRGLSDLQEQLAAWQEQQ